jgi:uncharacterized membrane protein
MDAVAITVGCSWTVASLLLIALAIPLARGRVRRNKFYGIRLPESFQSDDAWYAINRFGGKRLIIWAVPLVLVGTGCFFMPMQKRPALTICLGFLPLVFILIPAFEAWRFARRYRTRP